MTTPAHACRTGREVERAAHGWDPSPDTGFRGFGRALVYAIMISLPFFAFGAWYVYGDYATRAAAKGAAEQRRFSYDRLVADAPLGMLALDPVVHGKGLFESACAACHKADGAGVDGLGKNLTQSWFVASIDDAQLVAFIAHGRAPEDALNTSKVPMPPKGGHDELTQGDLADIVTYVRGLQDPRRLPPLPASALVAAPIAPPTQSEKAQALAAAGGDAELAEYIAHGNKVFAATCAACHGKDARGAPKLGKDLLTSEFSKELDDDALLAFLKKGRDPGDPLNTTKVGMPPRGGNPALSDDDLLDVISYVRSLQKQVSAP